MRIELRSRQRIVAPVQESRLTIWHLRVSPPALESSLLSGLPGERISMLGQGFRGCGPVAERYVGKNSDRPWGRRAVTGAWRDRSAERVRQGFDCCKRPL